jgi:hypothetical protein
MTTLDRLAVAIEDVLMKLHSLHKGDEIGFICPSHNDSRPSARWHSEKRVWYCDVCGDGGGAVDLSKKLGVK